MNDGINLVMGDDGVFHKMPEPYMTLMIDTEEDWNALQDAVNRGNLIRWISVEDRLPDEHEDVLIFIREGDVCWYDVGNLVNGKWIYSGVHILGPHITHWMPLPEPPKGE